MDTENLQHWKTNVANRQFSWERFDSASLEAFSRSCGYYGADNQSNRITHLSQLYPTPTTDFVSRAFHSIQHVWLRRNDNVATGIIEAFIKQGIGPREKPKTQADRIRFIALCPNRNTFRQYYQKALLKYGSSDGITSESDFVLDTPVPRLSIVSPHEQSTVLKEPYEYQERAWDALNYHLATSEIAGQFEGLLVMPTGSGKTFTSARWLTEQHVNRKKRVLWLAHRHELLEQAAQAFLTCATLAKNLETLRIRIVSGIHSATSTIGPDDNVICCSVQSLARNKMVVDELLSDPDLFLVVDEAHHAVAKSYRDIIEQLRTKEKFKLLGLTATPTRTLEHEQPILSRLFGHKKIFEVDTRSLIEKGYLSRPKPVIVNTNTDIESLATDDDYANLKENNDLSEDWKNKIAQITERNEEITQHYLQTKEKYGKTLVFALNIPHADLLCERLRDAGIETDYVASTRLSGEAYDKREIIERFRDPNSGFDILINVMILTEGVDIPNVKTVFLTRPVRSEILLRQMVGRALRGPSAGGTAEAYLVSFEDRWREFEEWERPLDLLQDLMDSDIDDQSIPEEEDEEEEKVKELAEVLPWELIRLAANELRRVASFGDVSAFEAVPLGWYIIEHENEEDITRTLVPVYQHQLNCWEALLTDAERHEVSSAQENDDIHDEYFFDCDSPRPSRHHVEETLAVVETTGMRPAFQHLDNRDHCDPVQIAESIWEDQLGPLDQDRLIQSRFDSPLSKAIFGSFEELQKMVQSEVNKITSGATGRRPTLGQVQFEPWGGNHLQSGPFHNLEEILEGVLVQGKNIIGVGNLPWTGDIYWTRRPIQGWFGQAEYVSSELKGSGKIRINCVLDSPDVSSNAIAYLIWHEYLHIFLQEGHTHRFNNLERKWKGFREGERELDTLGERFECPFFW